MKAWQFYTHFAEGYETDGGPLWVVTQEKWHLVQTQPLSVLWV
jgi:hypothetical protein